MPFRPAQKLKEAAVLYISPTIKVRVGVWSLFQIHFKLQIGVYPVAVSLLQYSIQIHKSHTQYTYLLHTNIHITQNNTTKSNKQNKNKSAHKATQSVKDILQPMNTA
jgi:hypothetical protein